MSQKFSTVFKLQKVHLLLIVPLFTVAYANIVCGMVNDWYKDPNYSHGFLVPIIAGYFLWKRREELKSTTVCSNNLGLIIIIGSLFLLVIGIAGTEFFSMRSSIVFLLAGIVLFWFGWEVLKVLALPIAFLLFMVPLPYIVYDAAAFPLKLFVAKYSVFVLKAVGVVVWREGNIIMFPATTLEVANACSGLRSLVSLLALSVTLAFVSQSKTWKRTLLILLALPIAVLTNMFRVIVTGFLAQNYGAAAAEGFFHEFAGMAVFGLAMVVLVLAGTFLRKVKS